MSGDGYGDTGRAPLRLRRLLEVLRAELGTGHGWPADSGFEIMAGAVLVQNTAWGNVLRSLERLRTAGALELHWLVLEAGKAARAQGGWPLYAQRLGLGTSAAAAVAPPLGPGRTSG